MLLHLGSVTILVISSAELTRDIMKTNDLVFADRPRSTISEKLLYQRKDVAAAPYGEYWRQIKGTSVLHLLSNKRVQSFSDVREEETAFMIDRVKNSSSSSPVNLSEVLAELWEGAEKFWPDRFLTNSIDFKGHDFQLIPFGAGRRACPGIQFAISIEELALENLLHKFDWSLPGGATEQDLDMTESAGLTTQRKFPLLAVATLYSY